MIEAAYVAAEEEEDYIVYIDVSTHIYVIVISELKLCKFKK